MKKFSLKSDEKISLKSDEKLVLNVGGFRHETMISTLEFCRDTRLYLITQQKCQSPNYDSSKQEYFFDRNPLWFPYILNYYRSGKVHCPTNTCGKGFEEELQYWGIDESAIDSCCWDNYRKHKETVKTSPSQKSEETQFNMDEQSKYEDSEKMKKSWIYKYRKLKIQLWSVCEEPDSSRIAKVYASISMLFVLMSVGSFCLETLSWFQDEDSAQCSLLGMIEAICATWFVVEILLRAVVCPSIKQYLLSPMNWIDLCVVIPFFLSVGRIDNDKTNDILCLVRLTRVFRILKLSHYLCGLQALAYTLKASLKELFLLAYFLSIGVVIFSSLVYYAEKDVPGTLFTSIPSAFWWSIVTMTTVGYGDMVPETLIGKIIGTGCALCGVLVIALPVPVIVSNFSLFYTHAQSKLRYTGERNFCQNKCCFVRPWYYTDMFDLGRRSSLLSIFSQRSATPSVTETTRGNSSIHFLPDGCHEKYTPSRASWSYSQRESEGLQITVHPPDEVRMNYTSSYVKKNRPPTDSVPSASGLPSVQGNSRYLNASSFSTYSTRSDTTMISDISNTSQRLSLDKKVIRRVSQNNRRRNAIVMAGMLEKYRKRRGLSKRSTPRRSHHRLPVVTTLNKVSQKLEDYLHSGNADKKSQLRKTMNKDLKNWANNLVLTPRTHQSKSNLKSPLIFSNNMDTVPAITSQQSKNPECFVNYDDHQVETKECFEKYDDHQVETKYDLVGTEAK